MYLQHVLQSSSRPVLDVVRQANVASLPSSTRLPRLPRRLQTYFAATLGVLLLEEEDEEEAARPVVPLSDRRYLTTAEAAGYCGMSPDAFRQAVHRGRVQPAGRRGGGTLTFELTELDRFMRGDTYGDDMDKTLGRDGGQLRADPPRRVQAEGRRLRGARAREGSEDGPNETDKVEALGWLSREKAKVRAGATQQTNVLPRFSSFAASLMEAKIKSGEIASAATRELWGDVLENHLFKTDFADFFIDQIRARDLLDWKEGIRIGKGDGEYSPHTANSWLRILKAIVNAYVKKYELERNPALALDLFDTSKWRGKITKEEPNSLTPEELPMFLRLFREFEEEWFALVALGFAIGARPSSLRPLRRSGPQRDYDRETGELILRRSHTRKNEVMEATKNGEDVTIILPEAAHHAHAHG